MTYGVGVKELWELPAGRIQPGEVIYTMGYPLTTKEYGGAWIYGGKDNTVSLGFVTGLDYPDPRTDPQHVLQSFKQHPFVAKLLEGGKMVRYGAKTLPYGGWWSMPPLGGNGWMIVGDSAGFLNSQRLKGIHLAIKSGMLAAETAFEAWIAGDSSAKQLGKLPGESGIQLDQTGALSRAQLPSGLRAWLPQRNAEHRPAMATGGHGLRDRYPAHPGHERMLPLWDIMGHPGGRDQLLGPAKGDGKLTFDKLTDLYYSGTRHEEDQPAHLVIQTPISATAAAQASTAIPASSSVPPTSTKWRTRLTHPAASAFTSTRPTACTAKPATSWTPTRSSTGYHPRAEAGRVTTECSI